MASIEDATKPVVIHRDRTFEYNGQRYRIMRGSDSPNHDGSYMVVALHDDDDWEEIGEDFGYIGEVRAFVEHARAEGWPTLIPDPPEHGGIL